MSINVMDNNIPVVLIANGIMNAGGTESLLMEMFRHASGKIRFVLLVHYQNHIEKGIYDDEIRQLGVTILHIPSVGTVGIKKYVEEFKTVVANIGKVDILHTHLNGNGGIIAMAAKRAGIPIRICHCHADIHFTGSLLHRIKENLSLMILKIFVELFATDRWACSKAAWNRLYFPWHNRVIINNMIDTRKYVATSEKIKRAKERHGLGDKFVVGAVGRVAPIKNFECVLRAIVGTNAHFVCFGRFDTDNAYCHSLLELARQLGIEDRVHWMGNSDNVSDDIHCIDLFVMPSFTEGFGMAAIEAQAASIPSLLSIGVPHGVDVGLGLAKFINPRSIEDWHKAISDYHQKSILADVDVINKFQAKGYDSPSAVKQIEDRYISLISKR